LNRNSLDPLGLLVGPQAAEDHELVLFGAVERRRMGEVPYVVDVIVVDAHADQPLDLGGELVHLLVGEDEPDVPVGGQRLVGAERPRRAAGHDVEAFHASYPRYEGAPLSRRPLVLPGARKAPPAASVSP